MKNKAVLYQSSQPADVSCKRDKLRSDGNIRRVKP